MALKKPVVYMGFGKELDAANIVTLKRHYLPLGKIGGKPAWLNPIKLPSADLISCKQCKKVMPMLLQIYCSGESTNSFHRYIYVFMCPNNACQKTCNSDNFRVLRCQLPRQNDFYGFERMLNFEQDGEVDDPLFDAEKYAKLCNVCGALGTKMCARCRCTWYCTKDHQVIDWKEGHKQCCQEGKVIPKPEDKDRFCAEKENSFLFEELGVELDLEEEREDTNSDEEDDDEIEDEKMRQELLKKAQNLMTKYDKLAKTAFGGVYKIQNVVTKEFAAMKVALKSGNEELRITVNTLLKLKSIHSHHFAEVLDHGKNQNYNFIVLTLAVKNVKKLIEEKHELCIETSVTLAKQSLLAIADLHTVGKLHRDIKEENILIGKVTEYHPVLLSGFGLSTNFDSEGGATTKFVIRTAEIQPSTAIEANKETETEFILGSLKNGSLAGLTGQKQYRRHDFEAWIYMIVGWFGATLPWGDSNDLCEVVRMKEAFLLNTGTTRREFMQQLPAEIQTIIHHIFTLKNYETVDLKWALKTLDLILKVNNSPDEFMVDWDTTAAYREPPTSKKYYPAPKNEEPYYWLSKKATHFKLIYHGIAHWYGHSNPAASNRKNCVEFRCPVVGCSRKIYVSDYDEEKLKQGQKAFGLHVATPPSCTLEERDGYKMIRE